MPRKSTTITAAAPLDIKTRSGEFPLSDLFYVQGRPEVDGVWQRTHWRYQPENRSFEATLKFLSAVGQKNTLDADIVIWLLRHHPDRMTTDLFVDFALGDLRRDIAMRPEFNSVTNQELLYSIERLLLISLEVFMVGLPQRRRSSLGTKFVTNSEISPGKISDAILCRITLSRSLLTIGRTGIHGLLDELAAQLESYETQDPSETRGSLRGHAP